MKKSQGLCSYMHDFETNPVKAKALKQALWFDADKTVRTKNTIAEDIDMVNIGGAC